MNAIKYKVATTTTEVRHSIAELTHRYVMTDLFDSDDKIYGTLEDAIADAKTRETGWEWLLCFHGIKKVRRVYVEIRPLYWDEDSASWERMANIVINVFFDLDHHFGDLPKGSW